jgi:hypothetical protein
MNEPMAEPIAAGSLPEGTIKGYSIVGRKLLTVSATSVTSDDSLIESLLKTTFPGMSPEAGETLEAFAERVAVAAGLTVAKWEPAGEKG